MWHRGSKHLAKLNDAEFVIVILFLQIVPFIFQWLFSFFDIGMLNWMIHQASLSDVTNTQIPKFSAKLQKLRNVLTSFDRFKNKNSRNYKLNA